MGSELNVEHTTDINAPIARVWQTLINFDLWEQWNPMVRKAEGVAQTDSYTTVHFKTSLNILIPFKIHIIKAEDNSLIWDGKVMGVDGRHYFHLSPLGDDQTRLVHGMDFRGGLVRLAGFVIKGQTDRSFLAMNLALKDRCEAQSS